VQEICRRYEDHFYPATFNNFAARMDWAMEGRGNRNPVSVINGDSRLEIMTISPEAGSKLVLDASGSYDPDGDSMVFKWWIQPEAGTYTNDVKLLNSDSGKTTLNVPSDAAGKSFHIICEITDNGIHHLTSYRRIIIEPKE
jgi:hypothetical protein